MSLPAKYPPVVTPANWNAMVDRVNGVTLSGVRAYPYSYLIRINGGFYEAISHTADLAFGGSENAGGVDGTDAAAVIQAALDGLTVDRTWKEKVVVKGNVTLNLKLTVPDYIILEFQGNVTLANNVNDNMIANEDETDGNSNIEIIIHGVFDGNGANQSSGIGIYLKKVTDSVLIVYGKITNTHSDGVQLHTSDRNKIPILTVENAGGKGLQLANSDENKLGLIYVKNPNYCGVVLYYGSDKNTIDTVIGDGCGQTPDPDEGGHTFRLDVNCHKNIIGKIVSYNSAYEGIMVCANCTANKFGIVIIDTVASGCEGIDFYDGCDYCTINEVHINNVANGNGVQIDGCDHIQLKGGYIDGTDVGSAKSGVHVSNSDYCAINVTSENWDSGCYISGSSVGTKVSGHYLNNTATGVAETGTADYTLLDNAVLLGNGTAHNVDADHSVVGDIVT